MQDHSSTGLDADGFYDGPEPQDQLAMDFSNVVSHPGQMHQQTQVPPQPAPVARSSGSDSRDYLATINAALSVLGSRLLALIAVLGAVIMFGWACYDPAPWRSYTDVAFAVVVVWPTILLHMRGG